MIFHNFIKLINFSQKFSRKLLTCLELHDKAKKDDEKKEVECRRVVCG